MDRRGRNQPRPAIAVGMLTFLLLATAIAEVGRAQPPAPVPAPSPSSDPKAKAVEVGPRVTSKAAADFLRPPGSSRYDPNAIDWREVPPWRQTSFFGIRAQGQFFIYVVDCSGSMLDDDRLIRAKGELRRSIDRLQFPQRFYVIFYNDRPIPMLGGLPRPADLSAKSQLYQWLRVIEPDGGTDPRSAVALALSLRPDAVFLLSDGEFPDGTVESIARKNPGRIPIHCIDLSGGLAGDQLARIARDSGGQYASRPPRTDEITP
jgi:von Willebrand factor type A domain